jgi:hypothetical protein
MHLSEIISHNNNLFYIEAFVNNNIQMVNYLHSRGYPQSFQDISKKEQREFSVQDINTVNESYKMATFHLIRDLCKDVKYLPVLEKCLDYVGKTLNFKENEHRIVASAAVSNGNIEAFDLICNFFYTENLNQPKHLLWYIHDARRSKLPKKEKEHLCNYLESLGLDWGSASDCLTRWANSHRKLDDFKYFYNKRRAAIKNSNKLKNEMVYAIESFLKIYDLETNLREPVLDFIATRPEFITKDNPYGGYFTIIKKAYRVAEKLDLDYDPVEQYFKYLLSKHGDIEAYLNKAKIPELQDNVAKILLKEKLDKGLNYSSVKNNKVMKI